MVLHENLLLLEELRLSVAAAREQQLVLYELEPQRLVEDGLSAHEKGELADAWAIKTEREKARGIETSLVNISFKYLKQIRGKEIHGIRTFAELGVELPEGRVD